jgi:hypothetical protein
MHWCAACYSTGTRTAAGATAVPSGPQDRRHAGAHSVSRVAGTPRQLTHTINSVSGKRGHSHCPTVQHAMRSLHAACPRGALAGDATAAEQRAGQHRRTGRRAQPPTGCSAARGCPGPTQAPLSTAPLPTDSLCWRRRCCPGPSVGTLGPAMKPPAPPPPRPTSPPKAPPPYGQATRMGKVSSPALGTEAGAHHHRKRMGNDRFQ